MRLTLSTDKKYVSLTSNPNSNPNEEEAEEDHILKNESIQFMVWDARNLRRDIEFSKPELLKNV